MQVIIYHIAPFDATLGTIIKFSWSGNQIFKNRCVIKNNETNETVYDNTVDSFKYEHEIDLTKANLVNGSYYNAFITVFDKDGNESDSQQLGERFQCLKTPIFVFQDLTEGQVISASTYRFSISYTQENGELLDSWSISLYTPSLTILETSGTIYDTSELSYTFSGFSNKTDYRVRAIGKTINGIDVDTGYVTISVTYSIKDIFSLLEPTNIAERGAIQIRSNIVSSEGHPEKAPVYINGEYVDLRDNVMRYTEGFQFKGDFSFCAVFYNVQPNDAVIVLSADNTVELTITVTYRIGRWASDVMRGQYEMKIRSNLSDMVFYSNIIDLPANEDKIGICITRSKNFYNIEVANLGKVVT